MDKKIFTYFDGTKEVKADPWEIEVKFRRASSKVEYDTIINKYLGPEWVADEEKFDQASEEDIALYIQRRDEGLEELIPVICETFGFKTLSQDQENGVPWSVIMDAFTCFQNYCNSVKKNTSLKQDLPQDSALQSQPTMRPNSAGIGTPIPPLGFNPNQSPKRSNSP